MNVNLRRAAPFLRRHRGRLFVVKIGGSSLERPAALASLAEEVALVEALGARLVLVHGGGPQTDVLQRALGEEPRKVAGRRVTTPLALRALRLATQRLSAEVCAALEASGARAIAVGGGSLGAERRPPMVLDGERVDLGLVGDLVSVDAVALEGALARGGVPVLAPPASDGAGGWLNVNADLTAARVACALRADKLVFVTDRGGILRDPADAGSVVSTLDLAGLSELERTGALAGGMRVKSVAIRSALAGGVARVHVVSGLEPGALLGELYTTEGTGTLVERESAQADAPVVVVPAPGGAGAPGEDAGVAARQGSLR